MVNKRNACALSIFIIVFLLASAVSCYAGVVWDRNGIPVCTTWSIASQQQIAPDGSGGTILVWLNEQASMSGASLPTGLYAQRLDARGNALWSTNGIPICTVRQEYGIQTSPQIVSASDSGAIITWFDGRSGPIAADVYAQRLDKDGRAMWKQGGIKIGSGGTYYTGDLELRAVADGAGSAIVVWTSDIYPTSRVYANKITAGGSVVWGNNGTIVRDFAAQLQRCHLDVAADSSGGAFIVWAFGMNANVDICGQRIDSNGSKQWDPNGVVFCNRPTDKMGVHAIRDGTGGAILAWVDGHDNTNIYAQRITAAGNCLWTSNGVPVCTESHWQLEPGLSSDGNGGAIIAWEDGRVSHGAIYAQRIAGDGVRKWQPNGIRLCDEGGGTAITSDGQGGAIVAWERGRLGNILGNMGGESSSNAVVIGQAHEAL